METDQLTRVGLISTELRTRRKAMEEPEGDAAA